MDVLRAVNVMLEINQEARQAFETAQEVIDYCEKAYIDLAHACELSNFNAFEGYQLAKQIKENQVRRREAKELRELLQPLVEALNKHQSLFKDLKNVHASIELTRNVQRSRTYTPRTNVVGLKSNQLSNVDPSA